jgi:hypothetical protein
MQAAFWAIQKCTSHNAHGISRAPCGNYGSPVRQRTRTGSLTCINIFIVVGTACLLASNAYIPWKKQKELMGKTFGGIYGEFRSEGLPPRPAWSWALIALGAGLSVLGYWRAWSGE